MFTHFNMNQHIEDFNCNWKYYINWLNTTEKSEWYFLDVDKCKIAFNFNCFEIDVNSTELAQKLVNLLNLNICRFANYMLLLKKLDQVF